MASGGDGGSGGNCFKQKERVYKLNKQGVWGIWLNCHRGMEKGKGGECWMLLLGFFKKVGGIKRNEKNIKAAEHAKVKI